MAAACDSDSAAPRIATRPAELADLAAEGFDPRFTAADVGRYRRAGDLPTDVTAEQARVDTADHLVLVFPLYWWSVPALLKGWIDRVFVHGWAFDDDGPAVVGLLDRLTVSFVAVAGSDEAGFVRHGYDVAMRTQLDHGVLDFCGAHHGATTVLHDSETSGRAVVADRVREVVELVASRAPARV